MCCFLRKPADILAKEYIARVCKINSYLKAFPTKPGKEPTKLPTKKLLDLLEFGVPLKWQRTMHLHGFKPQEATIKDFAKPGILEDTESKSTKKTGSSNDDNNKKGENNHSKGKKKRHCDTRKKTTRINLLLSPAQEK